MDSERYFEQNPWNRACECIKSQELGEVLQVSVQCVCEKGNIHRKLKEWETRMERLLGAKQRGDFLSTESSLSFLGVYGDGTIVSFFLDEGADDYSENFEIVTAKSLIIWKPDVINQGRMLSQEFCFADVRQQYAEELGEAIC